MLMDLDYKVFDNLFDTTLFSRYRIPDPGCYRLIKNTSFEYRSQVKVLRNLLLNLLSNI